MTVSFEGNAIDPAPLSPKQSKKSESSQTEIAIPNTRRCTGRCCTKFCTKFLCFVLIFGFSLCALYNRFSWVIFLERGVSFSSLREDDAEGGGVEKTVGEEN